MTPPPDGIVTLRELYALIGTTEAKLSAEIQKVSAHVDARLLKHEDEHRDDERHRVGMIRWAVTTLIAVAGVAVAIYVAAKGG